MSNQFSDSFIHENLMGPNVVLMFNELCGGRLPQGQEARICDLGCGAGLSSLAIAQSCQGTVFAIDAWNTPEENQARFSTFACGNRIKAVQADAPELSFRQDFFDSLVCLDSYNYFGRQEGIIDQVASYVRPSGRIFLGISGVKRQPTAKDMQVFGLSWSPEQMEYIKTLAWWEELLAQSRAVRIDRAYEMACHKQAWQDWISCENEYAAGDRAACEAGAVEMMCTIGIELTRL